MKRIYLACFIFILSCMGNMLSAQTTFCKTMWGEDQMNLITMAPTADSGCIILGYGKNSLISTSSVHLIAKLDASFEVEWIKSFGVPGTFGTFLSGEIKQTTDGGFACVVTTQALGNYDMLVVKFDSSGNDIWHKIIGETGSEYGQSIIQTADGGFLVAGCSDSFSSGYLKFYLVKLNASGNLLFSRIVGTTDDDLAITMIRTSDGGYVIAGSSGLYNPVPFGDLYVVKLNSSFNVVWSRIIGTPYFDRIYSIVQANDGGFLAVGVKGTNIGYVYDYYIVKLTANGIPEWNYSFGTATDDYAWSVIKTHDGGYLVTGAANNPVSGRYNCYALKISSTGQQEWGKIFGASNSLPPTVTSAIETPDLSYLIAANYREFAGPPYGKLLLMKVDSAGNCCCDSGSYGIPDTVYSSSYSSASISIAISTVANGITFAPLVSAGDTLCIYTDVTLITEVETKEEAIFIYPNPASSEINILSMTEISLLNIKNTLGEIVFISSVREKTFSVDVNAFRAGIYFVTITDEKKNTVIKKFVKM